MTFGRYPDSKLIGLSGTFGSGKDTAARHLVEKRRFMHVSTGDVLRAEASRRGLDHERPTLIEIGVELRRIYGSIGALVLKGIEQWEERRADFESGLVISGLRVVGEAREVRDQEGKLVFIDAPPASRYAWILVRAEEEGRVIELSNVHSLEDFEESERTELEGLGGPDRPHLRAVESIADVVIQNTGTKDDFLRRIDELVGIAP